MPITLNGSGPIAGATTVNGLTLPTDSFQSGMVLTGQQSFTSVSSVSFNNCFPTTYDSFRIVFQIVSSSVGQATLFRFRTSGSDQSGSNYFSGGLYAAIGVAGSGALTQTVAGTSWMLIGSSGNGTSYPAFGSMDVFQANKSDWKFVNAHINNRQGATSYAIFESMLSSSTTAADGFTFLTGTGTMTGTIRVYGYRNS